MKSNDKRNTKGPKGSVSALEPANPGPVVAFRRVDPPQNPKPTAKPIYQLDLEEYMLLTREMKQAVDAWKEKRQYIRRALADGAEIEPGIHYARQRKSTTLIIR